MDPRQKRTRQRLRAALLSLLREHDYQDIRIYDVIERADVALMTLYRNYANLLDLLRDTIIHMTEHLEFHDYESPQPFQQLFEPEQQPHLLPILQFVERERVFFKRLFSVPCSVLVFQTIADAVRTRIRVNTPEWSPDEVDVIVGCLLGTVYQWVLLDQPISAINMATMIHNTSIYGVLIQREMFADIRATIRIQLRAD